MKPKRNLGWAAAAALLLAMPAFAATDKKQPMSAVVVNDLPWHSVELYQNWVGEPVAIDPAVRKVQGAVSYKFTSVDKESALKIIAEALLTQAGVSIDRDAEGHLKAIVVQKPAANPAKP